MHTSLLFIPGTVFSIQNISIDVIKAPASIELSMIHSVPIVQVNTEEVKEVPLKKEVDLDKAETKTKDQESQEKQIREKQEKSVAAKPTIGAITEQISSLMVNKPPAYPRLARIKGWEGEVVLIVRINNKGYIDRVNVLSSSGFHALDLAASKAISRWHFRDVNKPTEIEVPVKFVLT